MMFEIQLDISHCILLFIAFEKQHRLAECTSRGWGITAAYLVLMPFLLSFPFSPFIFGDSVSLYFSGWSQTHDPFNSDS